jgi:hypothetical protein
MVHFSAKFTTYLQSKISDMRPFNSWLHVISFLNSFLCPVTVWHVHTSSVRLLWHQDTSQYCLAFLGHTMSTADKAVRSIPKTFSIFCICSVDSCQKVFLFFSVVYRLSHTHVYINTVACKYCCAFHLCSTRGASTPFSHRSINKPSLNSLYGRFI